MHNYCYLLKNFGSQLDTSWFMVKHTENFKKYPEWILIHRYTSWEKKKNKNERELYAFMNNIGSNMTELDITTKLKNWWSDFTERVVLTFQVHLFQSWYLAFANFPTSNMVYYCFNRIIVWAFCVTVQ